MTRSVLLVLLMFFGTFSFAQFRWDAGGGIGMSNYLGEMGGKEQIRRDFVADLKIRQTRWVISGFGRYKVHPSISIKGALSYGRIEGADSLSTNPGRAGRNLHFRNDLLELAFTGEFYFYQITDLGQSYRFNKDLRAYAFVGLAGLYQNPKAQYNGDWISLQPLRTEAQDKPYSRFQVSIPTGIGISYTYHRYHRISWDLGWRTTFTDYLDDVSTTYADPSDLPNPTSIAMANQSLKAYMDDPSLPHPNNYEPGNKRGDPTHNDSYIFSTISYSYVIKGNWVKRRYPWIWSLYRKYHKRKDRKKF